MVPEMSSRHSAIRAIMARAESLTALGAMPSAQLIVLSAVAFDDAVRDHFQNAMAHLNEKSPATISAKRDRQAIMLSAAPAGLRVGLVVQNRYPSGPARTGR